MVAAGARRLVESTVNKENLNAKMERREGLTPESGKIQSRKRELSIPKFGFLLR